MDTLTHKGWFLACPILAGDIDGEEPLIMPRRYVPGWWLDFNGLLMGLFVGARQLVQPGYDGAFPILFTGKLERPISVLD